MSWACGTDFFLSTVHFLFRLNLRRMYRKGKAKIDAIALSQKLVKDSETGA
jgi:hypothetical protein